MHLFSFISKRSLLKAKCESRKIPFIASGIKYCIHDWILGKFYSCFCPKNNDVSGQTLDMELVEEVEHFAFRQTQDLCTEQPSSPVFLFFLSPLHSFLLNAFGFTFYFIKSFSFQSNLPWLLKLASLFFFYFIVLFFCCYGWFILLAHYIKERRMKKRLHSELLYLFNKNSNNKRLTVPEKVKKKKENSRRRCTVKV